MFNFFFFLIEFKKSFFHLLIFSLFCYFGGIFCLISNTNNYLRVLFSLEIVFVSLTLYFIALSQILGSVYCLINSLILITFSAIDAAIGLALILNVYFYKKDVFIETPYYFKG